jgi:hypothetical protein
VSADAQVREAASAADKAISDSAIENAMRHGTLLALARSLVYSLTHAHAREDVFKAFMEYYNHAMPKETLTPVQRRRTPDTTLFPV